MSMRKGQKSSFVPVLETYGPSFSATPENPSYTIDGGYLLHRVVWLRPASFDEVCNCYVTYIKRHYGDKVTDVFDRYALPGTKDIKHMRRSAKTSSVDVAISDNIQSDKSDKKQVCNTTVRVFFQCKQQNCFHSFSLTTPAFG
jgi:hypothetical protein